MVQVMRLRHEEIEPSFSPLRRLVSRKQKSLGRMELLVTPVWATERDGKYYLILDYRPPSDPVYIRLGRLPDEDQLVEVEEYENKTEWEQAIESWETFADRNGGDAAGILRKPFPPLLPAQNAKQPPTYDRNHE